MNEFAIFADTSCDFSKEELERLNVKYVELTFTFDNDTRIYNNFDIPSKEFYGKVRDGAGVKTSAVNSDVAGTAMKEELENGRDILFISFSSGLSTNFNNVRLAAEELAGQYKERKIVVIDSLSASGGVAMLVMAAVKAAEDGKSLDETVKLLEEMKLNICHWFTVDDLKYLNRGGRLGKTTAIVGDILKIKPLLHVNNEGKLESISKCRGRKHAIRYLCDKLDGADLTKPIVISHGDCFGDAEMLASMIKEKTGRTADFTVNVSPIIGAHCGPGTLALFFMGKER